MGGVNGFVKGQHVGDVLGNKCVMGSLTDDQIRDHYRQQLIAGFGKEAIEELCRTEKKSREEIEKIIGRNETMITEEQKAAIIAAKKQGLSYGQIANKFGLNIKTVGYHIARAAKAGLLDDTEEKKEPVSEAYPGQIHDEPKYDEHELDFEKQIEKLAAKSEARPKILPKADDDFAVGSAPPKSPVTSVWESLIDNLSDTLCGLLGVGSVTSEMYYSDIRNKAKATIRTADGMQYKIKIEEVKHG